MWSRSPKPQRSFESSPGLSKATLQQRLQTEMAPPDSIIFTLDQQHTARSSLTSLARALAFSPVVKEVDSTRGTKSKKHSMATKSVTSRHNNGDEEDCDDCADCDECKAIMSPYAALSPPPEEEQEQDIGQDFNPHFPPELADTCSQATLNLPPIETLPPLPDTPFQQIDDNETKQLGYKRPGSKRSESQPGTRSGSRPESVVMPPGKRVQSKSSKSSSVPSPQIISIPHFKGTSISNSNGTSIPITKGLSNHSTKGYSIPISKEYSAHSSKRYSVSNSREYPVHNYGEHLIPGAKEGYTVYGPEGYYVHSPKDYTIHSSRGYLTSSAKGHAVLSPKDYSIRSSEGHSIPNPKKNSVHSPEGYAISAPKDYTIHSLRGNPIPDPKKDSVHSLKGHAISSPRKHAVYGPEESSVPNLRDYPAYSTEGYSVPSPKKYSIPSPQRHSVLSSKGKPIIPSFKTILIPSSTDASMSGSKNTAVNHDGISKPHGGKLCQISSLELQSFPDEPIGGLSPPALTPTKYTGNTKVQSAELDVNPPQIRVATPCISKKPTQVSREGIRSTTGSIHSLPETVISELLPNTSPYQHWTAAMSDFLINYSPQNEHTSRDAAIYEHYNNLITGNVMDHADCSHSEQNRFPKPNEIPVSQNVNKKLVSQYVNEEPVAESSSMAAKRAAMYEQINPLPMQEKNINLAPNDNEDKSFKSIKSSKSRRKKEATIDTQTKKLVEKCAKQAKFVEEQEQRTLKHRDTGGSYRDGTRRNFSKGKRLENQTRVVIQEDGGTETRSGDYWTKTAQSLASKFMPTSTSGEATPAASNTGFPMSNSNSEDQNSSTRNYAHFPPKKPQKQKKPQLRKTRRSRCKGKVQKSIRHGRKALLRSFVLKALLGRQLAGPTKSMVDVIAKGGSVKGLEQVLDLSMPANLHLTIPDIKIFSPK